MTLANPQLTRPRLENTIRSAYSQRKTHEIAKQWPAVGVPAEPSNPPDGMVSRGGGITRQQQHLQQHWSRDGGIRRWHATATAATATLVSRRWHASAAAAAAATLVSRQWHAAATQLQQHWSRAVTCLGSSSSCSNTGLATVACRGNRSSSNTGLACGAMPRQQQQ